MVEVCTRPTTRGCSTLPILWPTTDTATVTVPLTEVAVTLMGTPTPTDHLPHMEVVGTLTDTPIPTDHHPPTRPMGEGTPTGTPTARIIAEAELVSSLGHLDLCSLEHNPRARVETWRNCNKCNRW